MNILQFSSLRMKATILGTFLLHQLFCLVFTTECVIELTYWWTECLQEIAAIQHLAPRT